MSKTKLLREQYDKILEELQRLEEQNKKDVQNYENVEFLMISGDKSFGDVPDSHSMQAIYSNRRQIDEYRNLLKNCLIVESNSDNKVEIGTTFTAPIDFGDGEIEVADYTLVEKREGISSKSHTNYISVDSDMGKAVLGKSLMEGFLYYSNGTEIVGYIESIESKQKVKSL